MVSNCKRDTLPFGHKFDIQHDSTNEIDNDIFLEFLEAEHVNHDYNTSGNN